MTAFYLAIGDGTTDGTVDISSYVMEYSPSRGMADDGAVTETCRVRIPGTITAARTIVENIGKQLNQANRYTEKRVRPRIYVLFDWSGSGGSTSTSYRSQIITADDVPDRDALQKYQAQGGAAIVFDLTWTRVNFWESRAIVSSGQDTFDITNGITIIAVTGENVGTGDGGTLVFTGTFDHGPVHKFTGSMVIHYTLTGAATAATVDFGDYNGSVYSTDIASLATVAVQQISPFSYTLTFASAPDVATAITADYWYGQFNYVDTSPVSSSVLPATCGDLPNAVQITVNNDLAASDLSYLWVASAQADIDTNFFPVVYGYEATGPTPANDASAAGWSAGAAAYQRGDYTLSTAAEEKMFQWLITVKPDGAYYVPIAKFINNAGNIANVDDIYFRWKIADENSATAYLFQGEQFRLDTIGTSLLIRELGVIQLPPYEVTTPTQSTKFYLQLWGQRVSGSIDISLDFIQLFPADGFVKAIAIAGGAGEDEQIVLNWHEGLFYTDETRLKGNIETLFGQPQPFPNKSNRLYFLYHSATANTAAKDWPVNITLNVFGRHRGI